MKTSQRKGLSPEMRYKMATMKRYTRFTFWVPPLVVLSVIFIAWQYQQHPEWLLGGQGEQLPASTQLEEPGIYDDVPQELIDETIRLEQAENALVNPQVPLPTISPALPVDPSAQVNINYNNPFLPSQNQNRPSQTPSPGAKLPQLFPPLFPVQNRQNQETSAPSPTPASSFPSKLEPNRESELQKAMQRRREEANANNNPSVPSSQIPSNQPTYSNFPRNYPVYNGYPTPSGVSVSPYPNQNPNNPYAPAPATGIPNNTYAPSTGLPNNPYAPAPATGIPNNTYAPSTGLPNNAYSAPPSSSYYNYSGQSSGIPSNPYGQPYPTTPTNPTYNYNNTPYGTPPTQVPTINGRPAPQFQRPLDSNY